MRIERSIKLLKACAKKSREHLHVRPGKVRDVRIKAPQQLTPTLRVRSVRPIGANLCFFENIVAPEKLIRAFAGQNNFEAMLSHQLGKKKHWGRGGAHDRCFDMPDQLRKDPGDIAVRGANDVMLGAERAGHLLLVLALIKLRVV